MIRNMMRKDVWRRITMSAALFALLSNNFNSFAQSTDGIGSSNDYNTATPIKHLIVLVGENRTFDHLFATYVPPRGETVSNLLSKGIVDADGRPGRNFKIAQQFQAVAPFDNKYFINLTSDQKTPYEILPEPTLNDAPTTPFLPVGTPDALLALVEPSLEAEDLNLLTTGTATEFSQTTVQPDPDTRVENFNDLPNGSFLLHGSLLPYDSYTGDTTHRLFEMWQQSDCKIFHATFENPSGCLSDLYPFVITNYTNQPDPAHKGAIDDKWWRQFDGFLQRSARRCAILHPTCPPVLHER